MGSGCPSTRPASPAEKGGSQARRPEDHQREADRSDECPRTSEQSGAGSILTFPRERGLSVQAKAPDPMAPASILCNFKKVLFSASAHCKPASKPLYELPYSEPSRYSFPPVFLTFYSLQVPAMAGDCFPNNSFELLRENSAPQAHEDRVRRQARHTRMDGRLILPV